MADGRTHYGSGGSSNEATDTCDDSSQHSAGKAGETPSEVHGDFELAWAQYKEEYKLDGAAATRQLFACCLRELDTGVSRTTGGGQFKISETD